jgi:hypothetical protein
MVFHLIQLCWTALGLFFFWWTCHSYRWWLQVIFTIMNSLLNSQYQLWNIWSEYSLSPQIANVLLVSMWWSGSSGKSGISLLAQFGSSGMLVVNPVLSVGIYCHPLNGNQLEGILSMKKQCFSSTVMIRYPDKFGYLTFHFDITELAMYTYSITGRPDIRFIYVIDKSVRISRFSGYRASGYWHLTVL